MNDIDLTLPKGAAFSADRRFRYALWRVWNRRPLLMFIGLNPSKAGEMADDPTITRMVARAFRGGYGGLLVANLFAYVSTDPTALLGRDDLVGEMTDQYLRHMVSITERQLCGWGSFLAAAKRAAAVYQMLTNPACLGVNADSQPKHPLYLPYSTPMVRWERFEVVR